MKRLSYLHLNENELANLINRFPERKAGRRQLHEKAMLHGKKMFISGQLSVKSSLRGIFSRRTLEKFEKHRAEVVDKSPGNSNHKTIARPPNSVAAGLTNNVICQAEKLLMLPAEIVSFAETFSDAPKLFIRSFETDCLRGDDLSHRPSIPHPYHLPKFTST